MNPKTLRSMARTMLELADAFDEGKVDNVKSDFNIRHIYFKPRNFSSKLGDELDSPITDSGIICEHELNAYMFYLVGAKCSVNGQFFINDRLSRVLEEKAKEVLL